MFSNLRRSTEEITGHPDHSLSYSTTLKVCLFCWFPHEASANISLPQGEIPEAHRSTVLTLYRIWMFLILVLCVNLVGAILLLISGGWEFQFLRLAKFLDDLLASGTSNERWCRFGSSNYVFASDWCLCLILSRSLSVCMLTGRFFCRSFRF